jgi:hypothetical protein
LIAKGGNLIVKTMAFSDSSDDDNQDSNPSMLDIIREEKQKRLDSMR